MATKRSKKPAPPKAKQTKQPARTPKPPQHPQRRKPPVAEPARARRTKLLVFAGIALLIVVAAVLAVVLTRGDGSTVTGEPLPTAVDGVPQQGLVLGRPSAPVTLVEYADLQCPFCAQFALDVLPTIVRRYVRTGRVKIEYRGISFIGDDSRTALDWALGAAQQNRLWQMIELLFQSQGPENSGWVTEDLLRDVARSAGADADRVASAAASDEVQREVDAAARSADRLGISSTPSFLVGPTGRQLRRVDVSALEPSQFAEILDEELARAG